MNDFVLFLMFFLTLSCNQAAHVNSNLCILALDLTLVTTETASEWKFTLEYCS